MQRIQRYLELQDKIEIVPIGDVHYGSENCSIKRFKETLQYVLNTDNCYMIGMGDYLDSIVPSDKRYDPSKKKFMFIDELIRDMMKMLKPLADEGKIIALLTGNHEYTLHKTGHGDPTLRFCIELGKEDKPIPYGGYSSFIRLGLLNNTYKVKGLVLYVHHGWSAGRKTGAVINNVENLAQYYDADVYLVAHSHKLWGTREVRITWAGEEKVIFGNTGTFLETATEDTCSYSERAGYPPLKLGVLKLKWYPKREDIHLSE